MSYQEISYDVDRGAALVTLQRPEKLNAYTPDMGDELVDALRRAIGDETVTAIVLTGAGRAFCAGADRGFYNGEQGRCGLRLGEEHFLNGFVTELAACEKPLIVAVNGVASGIGATMLLPFDIRLASDNAALDFPFVRLGVSPGFASSYFLPRLVGAGSANDILLNSRKLGAQSAKALGLVQQIIAPDQLLSAALAMARYIGASPPGIVARCKQLLSNGCDGSLANAIEREQFFAREMISNFQSQKH
jgi:enoyl-CoA hydratase/carnithine racemase